MSCSRLLLLLVVHLADATSVMDPDGTVTVFGVHDVSMTESSICTESGATPAEPKTPDEIAGAMKVFPPIDSGQMKIYIAPSILRIDAIDPSAGTWTLRMQSDFYYDMMSCEMSATTSRLCHHRLGGLFRFVIPQGVQLPDGARLNANVSLSEVASSEYGGKLSGQASTCLHADYVDTSFIIGVPFVPLYYP
eukprot:6090955-Prymnesium_polylepis.1